jgi:hypothetical protein
MPYLRKYEELFQDILSRSCCEASNARYYKNLRNFPPKIRYGLAGVGMSGG